MIMVRRDNFAILFRPLVALLDLETRKRINAEMVENKAMIRNAGLPEPQLNPSETPKSWADFTPEWSIANEAIPIACPIKSIGAPEPAFTDLHL
tara:strand:- start:3013 stop:3294 length:282 start_codon:yes stop_codon:yes gene_type:complete